MKRQDRIAHDEMERRREIICCNWQDSVSIPKTWKLKWFQFQQCFRRIQHLRQILTLSLITTHTWMFPTQQRCAILSTTSATTFGPTVFGTTQSIEQQCSYTPTESSNEVQLESHFVTNRRQECNPRRFQNERKCKKKNNRKSLINVAEQSIQNLCSRIVFTGS